jgi:fibronectin-binding autotransporter adhesin
LNTFTGATSNGSFITGGTLETHYTSPLGTGPVSLTNVNWNSTTNNQVSAGTVTLNGAISFNTSSNLNLSGGITGAGTLSKSGPGTLEIGGIGTNTGTINVTQGTVQLDSMNALGGNSATGAVAPDETFSNSNLVLNGTGKGSSGQDAQLTHNITLTNANVSRNDLTPGQVGSSTSNGDSNITAYDSTGNYSGGLMTINGNTSFTNNELRTAANGDPGGVGSAGHSNQLATNMPIVVTSGSTLTANAINGALSVTTDPGTGITSPTGTLSNTAVAFHGTSILNNPNQSITLDSGATLALVGAGEKRIGSGSTGLPVVGLGTSGAESTFKADAVTFMSDAVTDVNSVNSLFVVAGSGLGGLRVEAPLNANYTLNPTTGQIATSGLFGNNPDTSSTSAGNVYTIMSPNRYAGLSGFTNMPSQTADGAALPALGGTITLASTTAGTGAVDNGPAAGTAVKLGLDNTTSTPGAVTYTLDASANGGSLSNFGGLVLRQTGSATVTTQLLNDVSLHGSNSSATTFDQLGGTLNLNGHSLTVGAAANISGGEIMGAGSSFNAGSINFSAGALAPESGPSTPGTLTLTGNTTFGHSALMYYELGTTGGVNSLTEVHGNLTLSGTLDVTGLSGFGAGTYRLMDYTGSLVNNTLTVGTLPAGFTAKIDLSVPHEVNLVVSTASTLAGDANGDGIVNSQDLAVVSSEWLLTGKNPYQSGDVNHDGIVNSQDLAVISSNWLATAGSGGAMALGFSQSAGSTSAVPEPGTYALCLIGIVTTLGWRALRRRPVAA